MSAPLDPHTLRVVLEKLNTSLEFWRENINATAYSAIRADELQAAVTQVNELLATTSDRARVVVLPEPNTRKLMQAISTGCGRWRWDYMNFELEEPERAIAHALAILAAVEFAGGAK